jgi:hypothetical protein
LAALVLAWKVQRTKERAMEKAVLRVPKDEPPELQHFDGKRIMVRKDQESVEEHAVVPPEPQPQTVTFRRAPEHESQMIDGEWRVVFRLSGWHT